MWACGWTGHESRHKFFQLRRVQSSLWGTSFTQVALLIPADPWKGESKHCEQNATRDGTGQAQERQRQVTMSFQPIQPALLWGCAEAVDLLMTHICWSSQRVSAGSQWGSWDSADSTERGWLLLLYCHCCWFQFNPEKHQGKFAFWFFARSSKTLFTF